MDGESGAHQPKSRGVWVQPRVEADWEKILPLPGFRVLPLRWVIERTFSRYGQNRRLRKDYDLLCETEETWIYAAMTRFMVKRLAAA